MRQLLERWAAVEAERCEFTESGYLVTANEEDERHLAHDLTFWDLIWIQGVVQEAIVSRGWAYSQDYIRAHERYYAAVRTGDVREIGDSISNPAEALLSAYLKALEETK